MTNETELPVELTESYAHRVGEGLHLVVQVSGEGPTPVRDRLELRKGKRVVGTDCTPVRSSTGTMIQATVPVADLGAGTWRLRLATAAAADRSSSVPLEARLVYHDRGPVALLPGPRPTTRLPAPRPASGPASRTPSRPRFYRSAAKVLDIGLRVLPDDRAARYREALQKTGRRLLG